MDYEEMENAIVENDPIYLYFNSAPDEISVEKELTENNKEIWIKTSTEYDDFTYLGAYKLDCKIYDTNGEKKWLVDNLEILYDEIRFIPTKYDYSGSWMTEDGHNCYYIDNIDWENGRISSEDDSTFSRELEGYIDNSDGNLRFGMKIKSEDISAFKFEFIYSILCKPCVFKAYRLLNIQTLCIFPCFCPYEPKQGKFFMLRRLPYPVVLRKYASLPL